MTNQAFTFQLSDRFLSIEEQSIFEDFLRVKFLEPNIWQVFEKMFNSGLKGTTPLILRAYQGSELVGAAIIIKCSKYGRALFNNNLLSTLMDATTIPFYLWIRFGCCMDMMSNQGFVKHPEMLVEVTREMAEFLRKKHLLTFINDYSENVGFYKKFSCLPSLPHALIDCSELSNLDDYLGKYKNIRRKMKKLQNKGGVFEIVPDRLNQSDIESLKECFLSTAEKSAFYLPYQDLYLNAAINTSEKKLKEVCYFVVRLNGEFIGYQAAIKSGSHLNALHGAFDRRRKSTFHAYDILFAKMTEFALENGLKSIDFGAVLNKTKQRMINKTIDMTYFIGSKYKLLQFIMKAFLKLTKIQGKKQMQYRS